MRRRASIYVLITLLGLFVLICGCFSNINNGIDLPSDKYIAIQIEKFDTGTLVSGNNPVPPEAPVRPFFYYNKTTGFPTDYPNMNQSFKILLGSYYVDSPPGIEKSSLSVRGIYGLPYTTEFGVKITNVYDNGTIELNDGNGTFNLNPEDKWVYPSMPTRIETKNGSYNGINYSITVKYTTKWQITNKGVYNK
jgi:hypothetical protein